MKLDPRLRGDDGLPLNSDWKHNVKKTDYNMTVPHEAEVVTTICESPTVFTLNLHFTDPQLQKQFCFQPGQFNMVYLYGVGEVAISILSDTDSPDIFQHTIRAVGRVTKGLSKLNMGDHIGIRGPFGRGWPLEKARGKDVFIVTGGLGCAPVVSLIDNLLLTRAQFGDIKILQGVKSCDEFIFNERYQRWQQQPNIEVLVAADAAGPDWPWQEGFVTSLIEQLECCSTNTIAFLCGPEGMMASAIPFLKEKGLKEQDIYLSMERNMACGVGLCGHCQYGGKFICKNGPVFSYSQIKNLFEVDGF